MPRFQKTLLTGTSIFMSAALSACQPPSSGQSCAQAVQQGKPNGKASGSPLLGGFLEIDAVKGTDLDPYRLPQGSKADQKRCSAYFEIRGTDSSKVSFDLWTAAHCIRAPFVESFAAQVFIDGGYVRAPLRLELFDGIRKARFDSAALPSDVQAEILRAFTPVPTKYGFGSGEDARAELLALGRPLCQSSPSGATSVGVEKVCFMLEDTAVYRGELNLSDVLETDRAALLNSARSAQAAQGSFSESGVFLAWKKAVQEALRLDREMPVAALADEIASCNSASTLCQSKGAVSEVLRKNALPSGRDIIQEALNAKEKNSGPLPLTQAKERENSAARKELVRAWKSMQDFLIRTTSTELFVLSNVSTADGFALKSIPISTLSTGGKTASRFFVRDYGFVYLAGKQETDTYFRPGDSGSMILADGRFPLTAVSSANSEDTSGGASVVALPPRRKLSDNQKTQTASEKKQAPVSPMSREQSSVPDTGTSTSSKAQHSNGSASDGSSNSQSTSTYREQTGATSSASSAEGDSNSPSASGASDAVEIQSACERG